MIRAATGVESGFVSFVCFFCVYAKILESCAARIPIWVVVKIRVPFWVPIIIRHLLFRVAQKGT